MRGKVHNAKAATRDGLDRWIASITDEGGRPTGKVDDVKECASEGDAIEWAADRLRLHGAYPLCVDLDCGGVVRPDLPRKRNTSPEPGEAKNAIPASAKSAIGEAAMGTTGSMFPAVPKTR